MDLVTFHRSIWFCRLAVRRWLSKMPGGSLSCSPVLDIFARGNDHVVSSFLSDYGPWSPLLNGLEISRYIEVRKATQNSCMQFSRRRRLVSQQVPHCKSCLVSSDLITDRRPVMSPNWVLPLKSLCPTLKRCSWTTQISGRTSLWVRNISNIPDSSYFKIFRLMLHLGISLIGFCKNSSGWPILNPRRRKRLLSKVSKETSLW